MQPRTQILRLREIVADMDDRSDVHWYTVLGIEIDGMEGAIRRANAEDEDTANAGIDDSIRLEEEYLYRHGDDWYRVTWPKHVTPKVCFDSDAWYQPVDGPDPVAEDGHSD